MLTKEEIERFSRQLLLTELGAKGQTALRNSSVLIVGAGGLGSPAALYLAAAGVGKIGIVDYDTVDNSNLQRQIIHDESRVGMLKAESAKESIRRYNVVLDATDNVPTRYLLNDACVILNKPLVSGSALRLEGQLTVYNYRGGPCYRCLFPTPPPPETVTNCSEGGVLGVVTGIIGSLQALETIKLLTGLKPAYSQALLLVDCFSGTFRTVKLRGKRAGCPACGETGMSELVGDYTQFCGMGVVDKSVTQYVLTADERVSVEAYNHRYRANTHILLDVRDKNHFDIASLPNSVNIPFRHLPRRLGEVLDLAQQDANQDNEKEEVPVYVVCRLGNDSQLAVRLLKAAGLTKVWDLEGGLLKWAEEVDEKFPRY
ncbi:Molybdenum cofactor synthesis protein 3 [Chytridiales sp. JEL 0842]|nr:Molybdenum cofactor synthesis protein 3 [Chytridiales sp. JEL 0842]